MDFTMLEVLDALERVVPGQICRAADYLDALRV